MNRILFLDYDGVVNTRIRRWANGRFEYSYYYPHDGIVNNQRAVRLISKFCEKYNYNIVVASTWAQFDNYAECLRNANLSPSINILCAIDANYPSKDEAIKNYLKDHPDIYLYYLYMIFDDRKDCIQHKNKIITCNPLRGFGQPEYLRAKRLHKQLTKQK